MKSISQTLAPLAISLSVLSGTNCSSPQVTKISGNTCETKASEFEKALYDGQAMLSGASAYIDMARVGATSAIQDAINLRPKVNSKLLEIHTHGMGIKKTCSGLSGAPRFATTIIDIRQRIKALGSYIDEDVAKKLGSL